MHSRRNLKHVFNERTRPGGQRHAYHANARVAEQGGVDELSEFFTIVGGSVLGNVANDGRADPQVEQSVVAGHGEDQNPDSGGGIAEVVQDKGP